MFSTFKARLIGILLVINVCVLTLGASASFFLGDISGRLDGFTNGIYHRLETAHRFRDAVDGRALAVRNMALLQASEQDGAQKEFLKHQKEAARTLAELKAAAAEAGLPADVMAHIEKIAQVEGRYSPVAEAIVGQIQGGQLPTAIDQIQKVCNPTLAELRASIQSYMDLSSQRTQTYVHDADASAAWQRLAMLVTALLSLTLSAVLGFLLWKNVRNTLGSEPEILKEHLAHIAGGNLSERLDRQSIPTGSLLEALSRMQRQMREVVQRVRTASDSIATGSLHIASGSADLSERTELQASNLQRTATAMEDMNRSVQHNAETARTASQLATSVSGTATDGSMVMQRVTDTMAEISRSSSRIGDIIGVIDGIAFQTNILALNAAVEAARAGEQGRGFAVVASEVRSLAQRSSEAAREIKVLINESVARVEAGTSLVSEAGQAVGNIAHEVQRVSDLIHDLGHSAQDQAEGIAHVSSSVSELDHGTQQNTVLTQQSAAAANDLREQSQELAQTVSYFKL
jgi:methyl-accepting chemotaxis protein